MKGSIYGRSCYRVTDSSSISPYSGEYGFTANDPMFTDGAGRPISRRTFMSGIDKPSMEDADLLESVVDHILGGWSTYYPSYQSSQWISTTKSIDWAMWETARRLASGQVSWVSLAKIMTYDPYSRYYRGTRKTGVDAVHMLEELGFSYRNRCLVLAKSSAECLYYGRIFPKDITYEETWVLDESGNNLPEHYFIPMKHRRSARWIDNPVWDPDYDSFYEAEEKMQDRYEQIQSSRGR